MPPPAPDVLNPRRAPRIPARCQVVVKHRFSSWQAETEDLGPRGLQLVTPRLVAPGRELRLTVEVPELRRRVQGTGKVVWTRAETPSRLGIAFQPDLSDRRWFDALVEADPMAASAARRIPDKLPARAKIYLGTPPSLVVDFNADELSVLRAVRSGILVGELVAGFGAESARLLGALFSLVGRGQLTLDPTRSPGLGAWREVLERAEVTAAADSLPRPQHGKAAPADAAERLDRLLAEARAHFAAGRIAPAAERLREAQALAPDDEEIAAELKKLGPFA
jgi:PilZ domain